MNLHDRIREWLGINEALRQADTNRQLLLAISDRLGNVQRQVSTITPGLGRVIAKLDANFAKSEFDPAKQAESDRIAEEAIRRLTAEAAARAPYNTQD